MLVGIINSLRAWLEQKSEAGWIAKEETLIFFSSSDTRAPGSQTLRLRLNYNTGFLSSQVADTESMGLLESS